MKTRRASGSQLRIAEKFRMASLLALASITFLIAIVDVTKQPSDVMDPFGLNSRDIACFDCPSFGYRVTHAVGERWR